MDERRNIVRRISLNTPRFPFFDFDKHFVDHDRRINPDRRLKYIPLHIIERPQSWIPAREISIRYQKERWDIDVEKAGFTMGRSSECDLVCRKKFTSRVHARIEYHDDGFSLIDHSFNGTFIFTEVLGNVRLMRERIFLYGKGAISLGKQIKSNLKDIIYFTTQ